MKKYKGFVLLIAMSLAVFGCADTGKGDISTPNNSNKPTELTNGETKQVVPPAPSHEPFTQADFEQFVAQWQAWHDQVRQPTIYRYTATVWETGSEPETEECTVVTAESSNSGNWGEHITFRRGEIWGRSRTLWTRYEYRKMSESTVRPNANPFWGAYALYPSIDILLQCVPWEDVVIEYDPVYHYPKYAQLGNYFIEIRDFWIAQTSADDPEWLSLDWGPKTIDPLFPPGYCPYPAGTKGVTLNGEPYQP